MTDQPVSEGIVHGVVEELEAPPEPPPSGARVWMKENLFGGDTPVAVFFNGLLTVVFALLALNILRFLPSYIFNPERRWSAVTFNMKLMMVQAFPQVSTSFKSLIATKREIADHYDRGNDFFRAL